MEVAPPPPAPVIDHDALRREGMKRKAERDQHEFQQINKAADWFEHQVSLDPQALAEARVEAHLEGNAEAEVALEAMLEEVWGVDNSDRDEKLQRGLEVMVGRLPPHLAGKRAAAKEQKEHAVLAATYEAAGVDTAEASKLAGADTADTADTAHAPATGEEDAAVSVSFAAASAGENQGKEESAAAVVTPKEVPQLAASQHCREERYSAIDRRLSAMRAAERLDKVTVRHQQDQRLQTRITRLEMDALLVEEWEYRYKRRVAWSRLQARTRQFEATVF